MRGLIVAVLFLLALLVPSLAAATSLRPGTYLFRAIVAHNDGVWNRQGTSLIIEIPPNLFQSWPFKLLCAILIAASLWLAYALRLRNLKRRIRSRSVDRLRERERVARDMHDRLLQAIQALMLRIQLALDGLPADGSPRRDLEQAMDRADEVVAEGRDRLRDLCRTDGLDDAENALREIAARQLAGTAIAVGIESVGAVRYVKPLVWDELASIAAEVLFNAARHSRATEVSVEVRYRPCGLILRFRDNGIGIDPAIARDGRHGHYGIPGTRERAARVGARFVVKSMRSGGTEVTISAPAATVYHDVGFDKPAL